LSIQYQFSAHSKTQTSKFDKVDFSAIDNSDTDADGVKDKDDQCPNTPKGIKVDVKGCPLDHDNDGVPDYLDKEPNSKKGAIVDVNGITQTDKMILEKQAAWEAGASERNEQFNQTPSLNYLKEIDEAASGIRNSSSQERKLPEDFKAADFNHDGYISSNEITTLLDHFFDGESDFTVEKIQRLIDYFFEQ